MSLWKEKIMGLFEKIFPKAAVNQATDHYFTTLTAYQLSVVVSMKHFFAEAQYIHLQVIAAN